MTATIPTHIHPDLNCISYWLPRLEASGVPTPRTVLVQAGAGLRGVLDGEAVPAFAPLCAAIGRAAAALGYPAFLRTGRGSDKHSWGRTCHLADAAAIPRHVFALVEWCELVDFLGLPSHVWAVREFLELEHTFTAFNGMPVAREFRTFFRDGQPICRHGYWPPESIRNPSRPDWAERLAAMNTLTGAEADELDTLVSRVAAHFTGSWSLDLVQHRSGRWYAIDMATMETSFHWPGCENAPPDAEGTPDAPISLDALFGGEDDR